MIQLDDYGQALVNLQNTNFEGDSPWEKWGSKDVDAIIAMFGESGATEDGDEEDRVDRQSNVLAGRKLFALSQSKLNPYRFSRIGAQNGSYIPVIPIGVMKDSMCAEVGALLSHIRTHLLTPPAPVIGVTPGWPAFKGVHPLMDLWRMAPHQNWSGTLPERIISAGEAQWYVGRRNLHAYAMNEWQIRRPNGMIACPFDQKLVTDVGAIRFVSVTGRRTLTASNMSWVAATGNAHEGGFKGKMDAPKDGSRLPRYDATGTPYARSDIAKKTAPNYRGENKERLFGAPSNIKSPKTAQFTLDLHDRKPIRFYFSANHYRSIAFNVKGRTIQLNPWFALIDD